jgi:hypothetical protein
VWTCGVIRTCDAIAAHIRLEITPGNFPRYERNPNTGHDCAVDTSCAFLASDFSA